MSDDLTEAVRRLRGLRQDVERLKAARDESGEVRFLRLFEELTITDDLVETDPGADEIESVDVSDPTAAESDQIAEWYWDDYRWEVDGWGAIEFLELAIAETATVSDEIDAQTDAELTESAAADDSIATKTRDVQPVAWGDAVWDVDVWDAIEFLELALTDTATAADAVNTQTDAQPTDEAAADDSIATKTRDVQPVAWGDAVWDVDVWGEA